MFTFYIADKLYSRQIDKFYIGQTIDLENRIIDHNKGIHDRSFTKRANDWELFIKIGSKSRQQFLKIEKYLKNMRNRKYYYSLKLYPDLKQKLLIKFQ